LSEAIKAGRPEFPLRPFPLARFAAVAVLAGALLFAGAGCRSDRLPLVVLLGAAGDPVLDFAGEEIAAMLAGDFSVSRGPDDRNAAWTIDLAVDKTIPPYAFEIRCPEEKVSGRTRVELRGPDPTAVLHAVYTMLESAGVRYDATGPRRPDNLRLESLRGVSRRVQPAVEKRGIRLHLNFAMDISSYPLEEAKAYIRNLARLRMNTLTLHSYPGQWYPAVLKGSLVPAGNFFYGQRHDLPDDPILKGAVRNAAVFCIPDIEPFYDQPAEKGRRAMDWLRAVMGEAERVGLTIEFSLELRDKDPAKSLADCESVLAAYPMIDRLEIITQEDGERPVDEVEYNAGAILSLRDRLKGRKSLGYALGIYNTTVKDLREGFERLRRVAPPGVGLTVLPAHGARMAVENLTAVPITAGDVSRTTFYSWAEFDGLMYLQQNPVEGIRRLIAETRRLSGERAVPAILWNHWRTAENRTALAYAALASIEGPLPPEDFYRRYGGGLGLGNLAAYVAAMSGLDEADDDARLNLFNIGFCFGGYWSPKGGLANYGRYSAEKIDASARRFETVRGRLEECLRSTTAPEGRRYLEFLANRVSCTLLHLASFRTMAGLQPLFKAKDPMAFGPEDRRRVREVCEETLRIQDEYMRLHARMIEDRGCEGTLMSYYHSAPQLVKQIKAAYGGADAATQAGEKTADAPPAPAEKRKKSPAH
jgi:hypothetical protein